MKNGREGKRVSYEKGGGIPARWYKRMKRGEDVAENKKK